MDKRSTLKQIADVLGVSRMMVSRALREGTSVNPQLRAKIRETAAQVGYKPDRQISAVMSAIRRSQTGSYRETLAFIWTHRFTRSVDPFFRAEFDAANRRAEDLGYKLEEFRIKSEALNGRALTRILHSRGIRGVLISPPGSERTHPHIWLEWKRFCCVLIGRSLFNKGLARVQHDHFSGAMLAIRRLRRLHYKRIGLVISRSMDERSTRLVRAAFLSFHPASLGETAKLIFAEDRYDPRNLARWMDRAKPDVIVANFEQVFPTVEQLRAATGGDVGLAALNWSRNQLPMAGVVQQRTLIGERAVDLLLNRLQDNRFGLDPLAPSILIPGSWQDGSSVRSDDSVAAREA